MWTHRNHRSRRRRSNTETKKEKGGSSMRAPKKRIHHHQARPSSSRPCWLMESCPPDVFPKIMAFVGPESFSVFPQVHGFFQHLLEQDSTWKVLCEELYKWNPENNNNNDDDDDDPSSQHRQERPPVSWKDFYYLNPCVPVDCPTIADALAQVTRRHQQVQSIRVWLRPGQYNLSETIEIRATPGVRITIETIHLPKTIARYERPGIAEAPRNSEIRPSPRRRSLPRRVSRLLSCRSSRSLDDEGEEASVFPDFTSLTEDSSVDDIVQQFLPSRATLHLRSRHAHDQPVFRVVQGMLVLKHLDIRHASRGMDIWNGNAAIQIQPPVQENQQSIARSVHPFPSGILEDIRVTSYTGRGIVTIDGGAVIIRNSQIVDCAATGVYVGGPGSVARLEQTDVVHNGLGNVSSRRGGIARGHSGLYLEQGLAVLRNCNVSMNTLTGISAISPDNAFLHLHQTDLVRNGTNQLEMPPPGTNAFDQSTLEDVQEAIVGSIRMRANII